MKARILACALVSLLIATPAMAADLPSSVLSKHSMPPSDNPDVGNTPAQQEKAQDPANSPAGRDLHWRARHARDVSPTSVRPESQPMSRDQSETEDQSH